MVILNRKRLSLIIIVTILGVFTFEYQLAKTERETMYVTSTPVSGKVIILDAGHGTPDEGAESNNGTTEAQINLKITLKVQNLLEQSGCTVILTRSDDNGIYDLDKEVLKLNREIRKKLPKEILNQTIIWEEGPLVKITPIIIYK